MNLFKWNYPSNYLRTRLRTYLRVKVLLRWVKRELNLNITTRAIPLSQAGNLCPIEALTGNQMLLFSSQKEMMVPQLKGVMKKEEMLQQQFKSKTQVEGLVVVAILISSHREECTVTSVILWGLPESQDLSPYFRFCGQYFCQFSFHPCASCPSVSIASIQQLFIVEIVITSLV